MKFRVTAAMIRTGQPRCYNNCPAYHAIKAKLPPWVVVAVGVNTTTISAGDAAFSKGRYSVLTNPLALSEFIRWYDDTDRPRDDYPPPFDFELPVEERIREWQKDFGQEAGLPTTGKIQGKPKAGAKSPKRPKN